MASRGKVLAVIGAQYGSEGKGVVVAHLADQYDVHVRVGGPNAGHSFFHAGRVWKMQSVPVGWKNPWAELVIGRGGLVNLEILSRELREIEDVDPTIYDRLYIDAQAGVLSPAHHAQEGGVEGELHARIGSTGEGVGAARAARMSRDQGRFQFVHDAVQEERYRHLRGLLHDETSALLAKRFLSGSKVLLEGTQGAGLSLIHGPWPYVTSADVSAATLAADCGIPPSYVRQCLLVARTMPIRVAGNSGPLERETDWESVSRRLGRRVVEHTTVTHKVRRVGEWDEELLLRACRLNAPTSIALTFMDYLNPEDAGKIMYRSLSSTSKRFVEYVRSVTGVPVSLVGTGADTSGSWQVIETGRRL